MYIPPKTEAVIHVMNKQIRLETCFHLKAKNIEKEMVLYKVLKEDGIINYYCTCSLCYLTNISRKHHIYYKDD